MRRRAPLLLIGLVVLALGAAGCGSSSSSSSSSSTSSTSSRSAPEPEAGISKVAPPPGGASPTTGAEEIDPDLRQAIAEAAASGIPVRIPTELLANPPEDAEHSEVMRSPPDSYTVGLTTDPGCKLASQCTTAIFSGFADPGQLSGRRVMLAAGIEGVYEPGRCGAGCQFGTIEWQQEGNRYGVGVSKLPLAKLKELADSAISSPPLGG
jgi:hypothetical protein